MRYSTVALLLFFFFFQAEDGIRDLTVTGVQTCALPISSAPVAGPTVWRGRSGPRTPPGGDGGQVSMGIPDLDSVIAFTGGNYNDPVLFTGQHEPYDAPRLSRAT